MAKPKQRDRRTEWLSQLPSRGSSSVSSERQALVGDLLEAQHELYQATVECIHDGKPIPEDAAAPAAIALEAVATALSAGLPAPGWAAATFAHAVARFERFEVASLGEAFGVSDWKHLKSKRDGRLIAAVSHAVDELHEKGIPLKGNREQVGALAIVGDRFHMSTKKVEAMRTAWFKLCRETGSDPKARLQFRDPGTHIAAAIAGALRSQSSLADDPGGTSPKKQT